MRETLPPARAVWSKRVNYDADDDDDIYWTIDRPPGKEHKLQLCGFLRYDV